MGPTHSLDYRKAYWNGITAGKYTLQDRATLSYLQRQMKSDEWIDVLEVKHQRITITLFEALFEYFLQDAKTSGKNLDIHDFKAKVLKQWSSSMREIEDRKLFQVWYEYRQHLEMKPISQTPDKGQPHSQLDQFVSAVLNQYLTS